MSLLRMNRLSVIWKTWMFNQQEHDAQFSAPQVENGSEGEDAALQRDGTHRNSRRRFRRVNPRGERELITDGQDPTRLATVRSVAHTFTQPTVTALSR